MQIGNVWMHGKRLLAADLRGGVVLQQAMDGPEQKPRLRVLRRGIADLLAQITRLAVPVVIQQTPHVSQAGGGWRRTVWHGSTASFAAIAEIDAPPGALYNQNLLGAGDVSRHDEDIFLVFYVFEHKGGSNAVPFIIVCMLHSSKYALE
jgi:hypothetical protein